MPREAQALEQPPFEPGIIEGFAVKHVANSILQRDFEDRIPTITPMKLQKLVYFLHGWHLAVTGEPAIDKEFQAWPYGPVEESLYYIFQKFRNQPIFSYAEEWDGDEKRAYAVNKTASKEFYAILDVVMSKYMPFTARQLSAMTHQDGTPWHQARKNGESTISNSLIRSHFIELANNA